MSHEAFLPLLWEAGEREHIRGWGRSRGRGVWAWAWASLGVREEWCCGRAFHSLSVAKLQRGSIDKLSLAGRFRNDADTGLFSASGEWTGAGAGRRFCEWGRLIDLNHTK
jgi:hypothetical protein